MQQRANIEAARTLSSKSGPIKLLSRELDSASQHQAAIALNCLSICALTRFILCIVSNMLSKASEKPKRAHRGAMLSVNLDIIKCIWYDSVGYFGGLGKPPIFFYMNSY